MLLPSIDGGTVYAGGKSGYGAYDLTTAEQRWYTSLEGGDGWPCYASPQVCGDLLILLVQRRGLMALDRHNGKVVWERTMGVENPYARPWWTAASWSPAAAPRFFTGTGANRRTWRP